MLVVPTEEAKDKLAKIVYCGCVPSVLPGEFAINLPLPYAWFKKKVLTQPLQNIPIKSSLLDADTKKNQ